MRHFQGLIKKGPIHLHVIVRRDVKVFSMVVNNSTVGLLANISSFSSLLVHTSLESVYVGSR